MEKYGCFNTVWSLKMKIKHCQGWLVKQIQIQRFKGDTNAMQLLCPALIICLMKMMTSSCCISVEE